MKCHDLRSLTERYGGADLTLEEFAGLFGRGRDDAALLRMRRDRDMDFPAPVRAGSRPAYRLEDLVNWKRLPELGLEPDPWAVQCWALEESVSECASAYGSEAAFRLLGGAALIVAAGWRPTSKRTQEALLAQARRSRVSRPDHMRLGNVDFTPDPPPASDPIVMRRLIAWPGGQSSTEGPLIPDDAPEGNRLLDEVLRTWGLEAGSPAERFVELIETTVARLASRSEKARPASTEASSDLLVALADIRPGQVVLDPAIGEGNLLIAAAHRTSDPDSGSQTIGLVGRDNDERPWLIAKVRLALRGLAHALGSPDDDSLEPDGIPGVYERIVAEPGVGPRFMKKWLDRILELLADDGVAVVEVPVESVIPPPGGGRRWWDSFQTHVAAVVVAPTRRGSYAGIYVLKKNFDGTTLLVQIHEPARHVIDSAAGGREGHLSGQFGIAARVVAAHLDGAAATDDDVDGVYHRPLPELSRDALGPPRWEDTKAVQSFSQQEAPDEENRTVIRAEALALARKLRWYLDSTADAPEGDTGLPEDLRGALEAETTDEMRRALRRIEQRLEGKETRGGGQRKRSKG